MSGRTRTIAERHSVQIRDSQTRAAGRLASGGRAGAVIVEELGADVARQESQRAAPLASGPTLHGVKDRIDWQ